MIALTDVATKLEEILNSADCPTDFSFVVKSQGYHLDSIADKKKSINLIPVFITMVGGEYNPVPNLEQANLTYGVDIWFPVRFKETFYGINKYLRDTFVGKKLTIGDEVALCNVSVAEYGEIVGLHLDQFEEWVEDTYAGSVHLFKKEHDISEDYMNMHFNIYATTLGEGFIFGNDVKYRMTATMPLYEMQVAKFKLEYNISPLPVTQAIATRETEKDEEGYYGWKYNIGGATAYCYTTTIKETEFDEDLVIYIKSQDEFIESDNLTFISVTETEKVKIGTTTYTEQLVWDSSGTGANITPLSQQLIGVDPFAKNTSNITNFNKSIVAYVRDNNFWREFLDLYNRQALDELEDVVLKKTYTFGENEYEYEFNQIAVSYNENVELGSPLSFTLAFGDGIE